MPITLNGTTGIAGVDGSAATPAVQGADSNTGMFFPAADTIAFAEGGTEVARFDSNGRLGIGTTSPIVALDVVGAITATTALSITGADSTASQVILQSFRNGTGVQTGGAVRIRSLGDGTNDAVQMVFDTNSTEAMRIDSGGVLLVGKTITDDSVVGCELIPSGIVVATRSANVSAIFGRNTDDGQIVQFRQAGVTEGNISVSGTTVSYNGGHLSRWAQFPDNSRPNLLKGTVMSNLDQMSNWDNEDNEQLNCVQVSAVEGDANVAGVFVAWDSTDDGYNDILLAMTGDMVIRIGVGVTVQRGDLLMSAGDGTAKAQGDDLVRSKTIAKVTSTHVAHTYADGSYAVPCVLMAC
jgi:hypothetical protein